MYKKHLAVAVVLAALLLTSPLLYAQQREVTVWVLHQQRHQEYAYVIDLFREATPTSL